MFVCLCVGELKAASAANQQTSKLTLFCVDGYGYHGRGRGHGLLLLPSLHTKQNEKETLLGEGGRSEGEGDGSEKGEGERKVTKLGSQCHRVLSNN